MMRTHRAHMFGKPQKSYGVASPRGIEPLFPA